MKKIALLIGNSRGLAGTSKDILDFQNHLMSVYGGAWEQDEIMPLIDNSAEQIVKEIDKIKKANYDYVIIYFTGHGGCSKGTLLEINPQKEILQESLFIGLAPKQLNIYDCCRNLVSGTIPIDEDHTSTNPNIRELVKQEYDMLVKAAADQQVRIYSCQEGESSYPLADGKGSLYTQMFLDSAEKLRSQFDVVRIYDCHESAAKLTISNAKKFNLSQTPEIVPTKCLSILELPISFTPTCL